MPPNPCPLTRRRRTSAVVLAITLAVAAWTAPAAADGGAGDYVARINALRTSRGLRPLAVDGNLAALAQGHSAEMARSAHLHHTANLRNGVTSPWSRLAENVGMGPSTDVVWQAFLASPGHLANLVDPGLTHVGVAVTWVGGLQWTTHRFRAGPDGAPPPPPPPPPPPAPALAPAPAPARGPASAPAVAPAPPAAATAPAPGAPAPDALPEVAVAEAGAAVADAVESPPTTDSAPIGDGAPPAPPADRTGDTVPAPARTGLERWLVEVAARSARQAREL